MAIQLFGITTTRLNKSYNKALNCNFINSQGNPISELKDLLIDASSYEVNRRVKEGIFD